MTSRRKLKRRVRERLARTGESYMTALRQVRVQAHASAEEPRRDKAIETIEMVDLTEVAARLGIKCGTWIFPDLAKRIDATAALERLRDVLVATMRDPAFDVFRAIALLGEELPRVASPGIEGFNGYSRFLARVRAGVGGISEGGSMLALHLDGREATETVVYHVWGATRIPGLPGRAPGLTLSDGSPLRERSLPWDVVPR
jgi:hypothetical protein